MAESFVYNIPAPSMPDTSYNTYLKQGQGQGFSNFVGSLFGGYKNWAESQIAQYQNSYNQWQQAYTNAYNEYYNSPSHQASLYQEAGFNPNLLVDQATGSSSNTMSPISAQVPGVSDVGRNTLSGIGSLISMAASVIGLKTAAAKASIAETDAQIAKKSLDYKLFSNEMKSRNLFTDWQLKNQTGYWKDYLYNTGVFPLADNFAISRSLGALRYQKEINGIDTLNSLRETSCWYSGLKAKQQQHFNDKLQSIQDRILENKATISDVDAQFSEIQKEFGMGSTVAKLFISLLKSQF